VFRVLQHPVPLEFLVDQNGRYLEDYDLIATSFDKYIEWMAMSDEAYSAGWRKIDDWFTTSPEIAESFIREHSLRRIPEASDEYCGWWLGDEEGLTKKGSRWCYLRRATT